jgi:hypothetical protein
MNHTAAGGGSKVIKNRDLRSLKLRVIRRVTRKR